MLTLLVVYIGLMASICPSHREFALNLTKGDVVRDSIITGCNDSYTGGIICYEGGITVMNTTIKGFGIGILVGYYGGGNGIYPNTSGSVIVNNTIILSGNPDPNYEDRGGWGDGIEVFDDGSMVLDNRVSMNPEGYGRVGIVWDHAWAPWGPVPYGTYPSWGHNNVVEGNFISCYHIEDFWGVNIDDTNIHGNLCGRKCFMWNDTLSFCDSKYAPSTASTPQPPPPPPRCLASQLEPRQPLWPLLLGVAVHILLSTSCASLLSHL